MVDGGCSGLCLPEELLLLVTMVTRMMNMVKMAIFLKDCLPATIGCPLLAIWLLKIWSFRMKPMIS